MLLLLLACRLGGNMTDDFAGPDPEPCPQVDCRDSLTVRVFDVDGATPVDSFTAHVTAEGLDLGFVCPSDEDFGGGYCTGEGFVVWGTPSPVELSIVRGLDGPSFQGTLEPAYADPYGSEECGAYCMIADAAVTLEPCDGCG